MSRVVVVGSINLDYVVQVPSIPAPGETVIGADLRLFPGGKGANQAVAAAKLGAQVCMIGQVGADAAGERMLVALQQQGVDTAGVRIDAQAATGCAFITVDSRGENAIVVAPGANMQLSPSVLAESEHLLAAADVVVCQLERPYETVRSLARITTALGKRLILNPAPASRLDLSFLGPQDIITPNEHEAALLSGVAISEPHDAHNCAERLAQTGPKNVIITLGANGVWLRSEGISQLVAARKVKAVDTTAAGDSFTGALGVGLAGMDLPAAVELARDVAAIAVTRWGAQPSMPTWAEVEAFRASFGV